MPNVGPPRLSVDNMPMNLELQARLARRSLRRVVQMLRYRRLSLQGVPMLFANAFPKSGTHLLTQVLKAFTRLGPAVDGGLRPVVNYQGTTGQPISAAALARDLARLRPGDIAYGHLHAQPETVAALCREGVAPFFILRDPRDVVVSHVHYVTEMEPNHAHHQYYREVLENFDQRLRVSILGRPELEEAPFPDIRDRFEPYLGWLERPEVLVLRFEDFIADREEALGRIFDHAVKRGFPTAVGREKAIQILAAGLDPQRSPTFRSGKTGGWRNQFTPGHTQLFKETAGDLLVQLGYERDQDW